MHCSLFFTQSKASCLATSLRVISDVYCKPTIFSELLNLKKLAMTHEMLNLLALNVRSKVTRVQQRGSAMSLVRWLQEGDSSVPRETDGATASANKEV